MRPRLRASFAALLSLLCAWKRPDVPTAAKAVSEPGAQLDHLLIEVEGKPRMVRAGEELVVVSGDQIKIREAFLVDRLAKVGVVNLVGFAPPRGSGGRSASVDDRGRLIDTHGALKRRYSEGGEGKLFALTVESGQALHGAAYLRLLAPELRYAELLVNGKPKVLRDGEPLALARQDKVKVGRVVTNLARHEGVVFQIVEDHDQAGAMRREIRFLRGDQPFAHIPLEVRD